MSAFSLLCYAMEIEWSDLWKWKTYPGDPGNCLGGFTWLHAWLFHLSGKQLGYTGGGHFHLSYRFTGYCQDTFHPFGEFSAFFWFSLRFIHSYGLCTIHWFISDYTSGLCMQHPFILDCHVDIFSHLQRSFFLNHLYLCLSNIWVAAACFLFFTVILILLFLCFSLICGWSHTIYVWIDQRSIYSYTLFTKSTLLFYFCKGYIFSSHIELN